MAEFVSRAGAMHATAAGGHEANAESDLPQWKIQIQAEATAYWRRLRKSGENPTIHSILARMAQWCRDSDVRTDRDIHPSGNYLRTHVLARKYWTPPPTT